MKHIPVLTLTALAAAASAQTAPAAAPAAKQSFSYDRVVLNYVSVAGDAGAADNGVSVFAQATLGHGFYLTGKATNLDNTRNAPFENDGATVAASLGWAYSLPKVLGLASDLNLELGHDSYAIGVRAQVGGGLELGLAYGSNDVTGDDADGADNAFTVSAIYSLGFFAKGLTLNASYTDESSGGDYTTTLGIGYNF